MTAKLGSWLIVFVMLAAACGDAEDVDGTPGAPPETVVEAQPEATVPDQVPTTEAAEEPVDDVVATTVPGEATTTAPPDEVAPTTSEPITLETAPTLATTPEPTVTPPPTTTPPGEPVDAPPDAAIPAGFERLIAVARADLAGRLGIDEAAISLIVAEFVTWPDSSAGCPQPGMAYTQVLVGGHRLVLAADGAQFHYHSAGGGDPFYCANPQAPLPPGVGDT